MNSAYIMKNYDIVISGQQWNGNFALRNSFTGGQNLAELSLLEDTLTFKKGDSYLFEFYSPSLGKRIELTRIRTYSMLLKIPFKVR